MNAQMKLPFEEFEATAANDNSKTKWEAKMLAFHEANPKVYELVKQFTFDVIATGRKTFSMTSIFERIRWFTSVETHGDDFKLCQNYFPYYARMFMRDHPEHDGFFKTRALGKKGARQ